MKNTRAWLEAWQTDFSRMLRTPLDTRTGTLRARPDGYPEALVASTLPRPSAAPEERLAVYNRQYWFRLLTVMHSELLLTARLFGLWHFNQFALRFLQEHPPRHYELRRIADGFEHFLAGAIPTETLQLDTRPTLPRAALLQSAQLDLSFARVFCAPTSARLDLTHSSPAQLLQLRLQPSAAYARITEGWPLVKLRRGCLEEPSDATLSLPAAHEELRHWVLFRNDHGVVNAPITPAQARLYQLLEHLPLGAALAQLENEAPPALQEALPELTRRWLEQAVEHGYFHIADH